MTNIWFTALCFLRSVTVFAEKMKSGKQKILLFSLLLPQQLKITHHHINFKSQSANYISIQSEPADRWQRFHHEERGIDRFGGNR